MAEVNTHRSPRARVMRRIVLATLAACVLVPAPSAAQSTRGGLSEDLRYTVGNALLSGIIAGVFRSAHGGSFARGFLTGAAAGTATYLGKRVATRRFDGAGFLGRQIASVGGSVAGNARDGRGPFDRLALQLGLGRLYWDRVESSVTFRPDVVTLVYTGIAVADDRVTLDWGRTLSAGTPVFLAEGGSSMLEDGVVGRALGGVILLDRNTNTPLSVVVSHERAHVLQYDQQFALWGEPAERGIASLFGPQVTRVLGRADLSLALLPLVPVLQSVPRNLNPLEAEADHLMETRSR